MNDATETTNGGLVNRGDRCPVCGERRMDLLVWHDDDGHVHCASCGATYNPTSEPIEPSPPEVVADAIRDVTATMQKLIDAGERSTHIDAEDLIEVLLSIADRIDPPL